MTRALDDIGGILRPDRKLRIVDGAAGSAIWSMFDEDIGDQSYDSIADTYDRVIGSRVYQRIVWGNDISRDAQFAVAAARSATGWWLDAGCGSLLFTTDAHLHSGRPTVLLDLSVEMLRRARQRLVERCGQVPEHIVLLQGDVLSLPFRPSSFESILCPGIIHLFADPTELLESLAGVLAPGGGLFLSSLVTDRWLGRQMLLLLKRTGETPNPIRSEVLAEAVRSVFDRQPVSDTLGNMTHLQVEKETA